MSARHDVFIKPRNADQDLLRDLGQLLGSVPQPHTDGGEGYVVGFEGAWIDVYLAHDLEDVGGLEFSQFPFYLTVRTPGDEEALSREIARRIFRSLTGTGEYECFIVWNDTVLVDPE